MKRRVILVAAILLVVGGWAAYWKLWKWPQGVLTTQVSGADSLVLGESATIVVTTNQPASLANRRDVRLELTSDFVDIGEITRSSDSEGHLQFEVTVTPLQPISKRVLQATIAPAGTDGNQVNLALQVPMPKFFRDDGVAFVEMIASPDDDIYGSDITIWDNHDSERRFVVAGHAISSVCRQVSASVWRLAMHSDHEDEDFFVGAGFSCLKSDLDRDEIYLRIGAFAKKHPELWKAILKDNPIFKVFSEADDTGSQRVIREFLMASAVKELRNTLKDLVQSGNDDGPDVDAASVELLKQIAAKAPAELAPDELAFVGRLLDDPRSGVDLKLGADATEPTAVRRFIEAQPAESADRIRENALAIYDVLTLIDEVENDLNDAIQRTGLVKRKPRHRSTIDSKASKQILTALQSHAASDQGQDGVVRYVTEFGGGHRGIVLAPYFDLEGERLFFTIPSSKLEDGSGSSVEEFLKQSLKLEMAASARRTSERFATLEREALDNLERQIPPAVRFRNPTLGNWLTEEEDYQISIVDERGRQTGRTRTERKTHFKWLLERFEFAAFCRSSARAFESLATSLENEGDNPSFEHAISLACLDSFLRGWQLSFVDASIEGRFDSWISGARDHVWEVLFEQAAAKKIDLRGLISEGTVFTISVDGDSTRIEPRCVVDVSNAAMRRQADLGMFTYETAWRQRSLSQFDGEEAQNLGLSTSSSEASLSRVAATQVSREIERALAEDGTDTRNSDQLNSAFALDPQSAARQLVEQVLEFYPESPEIPRRQLEHARLLLDVQSAEEGAARERLAERMITLVGEEEWTLPDEYVRFADGVKNENAPLSRLLLNHARSIDRKFVEEYENSGKVGVSETTRLAVEAVRLSEAGEILRQVRRLSKAAGGLETGNDAYSTASELDSIADSLDSRSNRILDLDAIEGVAAELRELSDGIERVSDPDSVDRYLWKAQLEKLIGEIASPAINQFARQGRPSRQAIEYLVELMWSSGSFDTALDVLISGVRRHVFSDDDEKAKQRWRRLESVLRDNRESMLKGLVYTGQSFVVRELFSRKVTDFTLKPQSLDEVFPHIKFSASGGGRGGGGGGGGGGRITRGTPKPGGAGRSGRFEKVILALENDPRDTLVGRKAGNVDVEWIRESYTDTVAVGIRGEDGVSVLKIRPNNPSNLQEAKAAIEIADHLRRKGHQVPTSLPAGPTDMVLIDGKSVVSRERLAPGESLADIRTRDGSVTDEMREAYTDTTLRLCRDGADIDPRLLSREAIVRHDTMQRILLKRNQLARDNAEVFDVGANHSAILATHGQLREFHTTVEQFAQAAWSGRTRMELTGLVHDAHFGNYFYDIHAPAGKRLTIIDVGEDYLGPVGHNFAMITREARPANGWTSDGFQKHVEDLFGRYERTSGTQITAKGRRETLRAMVFPPYKFISSDSRSFLGRLRKDIGLPTTATPSEMKAALEKPTNRAKLDALLADPQIAAKYRVELEQLEFTLRMLQSEEINDAEHAAIKNLLRVIEIAKETGYRLAVIGSCNLSVPS